MNEDKLSELLNDPLLKDYLALNDRLIRLVASRIAAESESVKTKLRENEPITTEPANILALCSRLMQVAELYSMLTNVTADKIYPEVIEISDFLAVFTDKCSKLLEGVCCFEYKRKDKLYADGSRDVLTYIMLSYVRQSVLEGASSILFEYGVSDGDCVITAVSKKKKTSEYEHFGDFQTVYRDDIMRTLAARIGAVYEADENGIKLTIKEKRNISEAELRAPRREYEASLFSEYNIMLGDLIKGINDI